MKNIPEILNLATKQKIIYDGILSAYKKKEVLNARVIFTRTNDYFPPLFKHGRIFEHLTETDFIFNVLKYGTSLEEHDGCVFVYPNGTIIFGGIVDTHKLIAKLPVSVKDFGAARAIMKILTNFDDSFVTCALKCGKNLICYYNGKRYVLAKPSKSKNAQAHNYGIGFIVADEIPSTSKVHLVKMGGFKKHRAIASTHDLANKICSISYDHKHHDGFWHYSPAKQILSGPYLVVMKVTNKHARSNMGMKRLTASLTSHFLHVPTIVIREGTGKIICYGESGCEFIEDLQKEFDIQVDIVTSDVVLS
jgi:hypothetical protein